jgi:molecular chaperone GrpE|tara:strand:+ start:32148 stop:32708 length:561 start_codon:yes stop_codon:yes gene_type:complete
MSDNHKDPQEDLQEEAMNIQDESSNESSTEKEVVAEEKAEPTIEEQLLEANNKFIRLYAEFENFRKRTNKEKVDLLSHASAGVLKDLLPVMDDFERAIVNNETVEDPKALKEGFMLIFTKFKSILEHKGLKQMEAKGKAFDSEIHEAIANIPAPTKDLKGKVVEDVEKGYVLNDKVIRFAKVVVGQ